MIVLSLILVVSRSEKLTTIATIVSYFSEHLFARNICAIVISCGGATLLLQACIFTPWVRAGVILVTTTFESRIYRRCKFSCTLSSWISRVYHCSTLSLNLVYATCLAKILIDAREDSVFHVTYLKTIEELLQEVSTFFNPSILNRIFCFMWLRLVEENLFGQIFITRNLHFPTQQAAVHKVISPFIKIHDRGSCPIT